MLKIIAFREGKYEVRRPETKDFSFTDSYNAQQYVALLYGECRVTADDDGVIILKEGSVISYTDLLKEVEIKIVREGETAISHYEEALFHINLMQGKGWKVRVLSPNSDPFDDPFEEVSYQIVATLAENARRRREAKAEQEKQERLARIEATKSRPLSERRRGIMRSKRSKLLWKLPESLSESSWTNSNTWRQQISSSMHSSPKELGASSLLPRR